MSVPVPVVRLPRRKLSDEIDRLNQILDGLEHALLAAVVDAAREGGRTAVREVLTARRQAPRAPAPTGQPRRPSVWARVKAALHHF
jgi:hypothetical protein